MRSFTQLAGLAAAAALLMGGVSEAQLPAPNPAWKIPEVIAFIGVKKGDRVADVIAQRLTAALADAVGPRGKVYALEPAEIVKLYPQSLTAMQGLAEKKPNIVVDSNPIAAPLPAGLNAVFIRQNYHDLYDKFMGPTDVAAFNKAVFTALKPGGVYVILDHAAAPGSDVSVTDTLHRIDPDRVKKDVLAAGFKFDKQSVILANPQDDHSKAVFDPDIRDHTDQFLYRFIKPT